MRIEKIIKLEYIIIILLASLILSSFHFFRFKTNPFLAGYDQYEYLDSINDLKEDFSPSLVLKDTYWIDVLISRSKHTLFWMRFLPFIISIINTVLIYLILLNFSDKTNTIFSTLTSVLSPLFVYLYGTYNRVFFPLFFILVGIFALIKDKYWLSLLSFVTVFVLNPSLFIIIILTLFVFYDKYKAKNFFLPIIGILLVGVLFIYLKGSTLVSGSLFELITNYISDLGASYGIGIFVIIISSLGILLSWRNKEKYSSVYFALVVLSVSSLYDKTLLPFVQLILAFFAGLGLKKIWYREWESTTLKNYVLLLIFCGLVFSTGSYINKFSKSGPFTTEITSLEWLENRYDSGNILSHYKYGFLISSISGLNTYTDKRYFLLSVDKTRINQSERIFQSRDLDEITGFMTNNNLRFIWITEEMKTGLVWKRPKEGLLLILHNSREFEKIYEYKGTEIWEFIDHKE